MTDLLRSATKHRARASGRGCGPWRRSRYPSCPASRRRCSRSAGAGATACRRTCPRGPRCRACCCTLRRPKRIHVSALERSRSLCHAGEMLFRARRSQAAHRTLPAVCGTDPSAWSTSAPPVSAADSAARPQLLCRQRLVHRGGRTARSVMSSLTAGGSPARNGPQGSARARRAGQEEQERGLSLGFKFQCSV